MIQIRTAKKNNTFHSAASEFFLSSNSLPSRRRKSSLMPLFLVRLASSHELTTRRALKHHSLLGNISNPKCMLHQRLTGLRCQTPTAAICASGHQKSAPDSLQANNPTELLKLKKTESALRFRFPPHHPIKTPDRPPNKEPLPTKICSQTYVAPLAVSTLSSPPSIGSKSRAQDGSIVTNEAVDKCRGVGWGDGLPIPCGHREGKREKGG
jgi:hypothetical protein